MWRYVPHMSPLCFSSSLLLQRQNGNEWDTGLNVANKSCHFRKLFRHILKNARKKLSNVVVTSKSTLKLHLIFEIFPPAFTLSPFYCFNWLYSICWNDDILYFFTVKTSIYIISQIFRRFSSLNYYNFIFHRISPVRKHGIWQ